MSPLKAALATAKANNTTLTRDNSLETVLSALDFRNSRSRAMAKTDLTNQLVEVDGVWQHKTGSSIADAVEAYAADPENKFLFKAKTNKGGKTDVGDASNPDVNPNETNPTKMTTEQLLKAAAKGQFGKLNF